METNKPLTPSRAIHPGEILGEELKARGISQKTFAAQIECAPSQLCEVIKGKRKVGDALAFKLEQALGIPYSFWMKMQASYTMTFVFSRHKQTKRSRSTAPKCRALVDCISIWRTSIYRHFPLFTSRAI